MSRHDGRPAALRGSFGLRARRGRAEAFLDAVGAAYEAPPAPETAERHIAAMVAASVPHAAAADAPARDARPVRVRPWRMRVSVAFAASLVMAWGMLVGLSFAGVITLPEPIRDALSVFGPDLPDPGREADGGAGDSGAEDPPPAPASPSPSPSQAPTPEPSGTGKPAGSGDTGTDRGGDRRGDAPGRPSGDQPGGGGGDSPGNPGGDECAISGDGVDRCLPPTP